jgi:hypothetical protein
MAILKEWNCLAHGAFDGFSLDDGSNPGCPNGCGPSMVERAFRTPVTVQSQGYRNINKTFENLAADHGLSNMQNRSAVQDGVAMRRSTPETYRRLNQATEMIIHSSRANLQGQDAGSYFKPLSDFGMVGSSAASALRKTGLSTVTDSQGRTHTFGSGDTVLDNGLKLGQPVAKLDAPAYDGTSAGLPAGETT